MKKFLQSLLAAMLLPLLSNAANPVNDTVTMGAGYANDVFYSLDNGVVKTETRANWDIAFYTNRWSAGIQVNDGGGVMLYTYPLGDTSAWNNIDASGIEGWTNLVNSDTIWEDGAFNRNALGHPDYGWGVYNTISHDVIGDSLYIVKLANGSLKKLFIQRKNSVTNTFYFKYADIDGANEVNQVLDVTPYQDNRMFIYYSLMLSMVVDREPDINSWDLVFSRYSAIVYDLTGVPSNYVVVGIATNNEVGVAKHHPVDVSFSDWTAAPLEYYRTPIGHDWKTFDMSLFQWTITDSLVYFIQNRDGDIYKFYPDYFSGTSTGKTGFVKELLSLVGTGEQMAGAESALTVYPNPAGSSIKLSHNDGFRGLVDFKLYDLSGRLVFGQLLSGSGLEIPVELPLLRNGLYVAETNSGGISERTKIMIQR